jgi:hypothetical protein
MPSPSHPEYQRLPAEERQPMTSLIPLLRLADNLARGPEDVEVVGCDVQNSRVLIKLQSARAPDLAEWAASRVSDVFQQVHGRSVVVTHERP